MSFSNNILGQFLIVDIGHPMTHNCILLIKKSLQNVLSLACSIRDFSRIPVFGYGVLAPSFQVIQQWKILTGNFIPIDKNAEYLANPSNIGAKVTIKDYRSFLESSIENVVTDFEFYASEWRSKTETKEKFDPLHYWPTKMRVTLITRKGGSIIMEILKKFETYSTKLQKIEIVEIASIEDTKILRNRIDFVSYITITENTYDLDGIFKKWISGDETSPVQLQITLNSEYHMNCELHDCAINPGITTLPNIFSLSAMSPTNITQKPIYLTVNNPPIRKMEVVKKIGIKQLCPSIFFGFPQWIHSKRSRITNSDEFRYNEEIFRALCVQLSTAEIGLLARLISPAPFNKINPLYFIISDGIKLLMMNIVPIELHLPQLPERMATSTASNLIKEEANDAVRSFLAQTEMEEISPQSLCTGVYEHFMEHFKSKTKKTGGRSVKSRIESIYKAKYTGGTRSVQIADISPGEYIPKFLSKSKSPEVQTVTNSAKFSKNCTKPSKKRLEDEAIHPALMSPETMAKYRKYNSDHYKLPEVMEPGVVEK